jgi:hypothetical protein
MRASDAGSRCDQVIVFLDFVTPGGRSALDPGLFSFDPFWVMPAAERVRYGRAEGGAHSLDPVAGKEPGAHHSSAK